MIKRPSRIFGAGVLLALIFFLTSSCTGIYATKRDTKVRKKFAASIEALESGEEANEALARLDGLILRYPENGLVDDARFEIGKIYLDRGENEKAIPYLNAAISYQGNVAKEAKYYLGLALLRLDRIEEALTVLGDISSRDPHYQESSILIVDALFAEGEILKALDRWVKVREAIEDKELVASWDKALREAMVELKPEELETIASKHPGTITRARATYLLALRAFDEGEFARSRDFLIRFLAQYPEDPDGEDARELLNEIKGISQINPRAIGVILPLSGRLAQHGKHFLKGIILAAQIFSLSSDQVFPIELHLIDSGGDPDAARRGAEKLATEHKVIAIIGPVQGETALAAAKEAETFGVPIITLTQLEEVTEIGPMVFRNFITPRDQAGAIARYATTELRLSKFAVLHPDHEYGKRFAHIFQEEVIKNGGELVISQAYPVQQVDFKKEIREVAKVRRKIEAIFIPDKYRVVASIAPQLRYYGIPSIRLLGGHGWNSPKLIEYTRHESWSVEGAVFADSFFAKSRKEPVRKFVDEFYNTFGQMPDIFEATAYETTKVILSLLKEKRVLTRESLREELANLQNYPSLSGRLHTAPDRSFKKPMFILQVRDGKIKDISTMESF